MTDGAGVVTDHVGYDSFGNGVGSFTRYTYTGREWDEEAGLYSYRARWYDAQQGRFISEDPLGLAGGINLYAYVENDPLNFTDPDGLQMRSDRDRPGDFYPGMREPYKPGTPNWSELRCAFVSLADDLDGRNPWITVEGGGGAHLPAAPGLFVSGGMMINPLTLEICFYVKGTVRLGLGVYGGVGAKGGITLYGPSRGERLKGRSDEVAGDILLPVGRGSYSKGASGSIGRSGGSIPIALGIGPAFGAGLSGGVDVSYTKVYCVNTPNCPCNK